MYEVEAEEEVVVEEKERNSGGRFGRRFISQHNMSDVNKFKRDEEIICLPPLIRLKVRTKGYASFR